MNLVMAAVELKQWHKWFAWYPVKVYIKGNKTKYIWLETVERKAVVTFSNGWGEDIIEFFHRDI